MNRYKIMIQKLGEATFQPYVKTKFDPLELVRGDAYALFNSPKAARSAADVLEKLFPNVQTYVAVEQ